MSNTKSVFVAYASNPPIIGGVIEKACTIANRFSSNLEYKTWKQNDIVGLDLVQPIIDAIEAAEYVVADISTLNNNVVYEIGYAIGSKKRTKIIRSESAATGHDELNRIGIFDTLGYESYTSDIDLAQKMSSAPTDRLIPLDFERNFAHPLYLISCATPNETSHRIQSRIKKTRLRFRSFTPSEDIRLSASVAIENIVSSLGVVLEWRAGDDDISRRHNIRTAFAAGLSHAIRVETIIFSSPAAIVPLDFRNSTVPVARYQDVDDGIALFAPEVSAALQSVDRAHVTKQSKLASINLGDPAAENELTDINRYFLPSATYAAAIKGNVRTIVGRKGSGKTALWARIRNHLRSQKGSVVVDLKPEGYQLVKLREEVLEHLTSGQRLHLATAFWEYLLMLEVATKIIEMDRQIHTRNPKLTEGYQALSEIISEYNDLGDTDFSERLHKLSLGVAGKLTEDRDVMTGNFSGNDITNKIYAIDIKNFRRQLFDYLSEKGETWILFDNLDRGWPVHGLEDVDFVILRALIDAARKLQRSFSKSDLSLHTLVFIRDDIYTELVARTSDFGKEQPNKIDWDDPDQLRELVRLRLVDNEGLSGPDFSHIWSQMFCPFVDGEETSQYIIERSMMRPRNLLNLINHCRSTAINRQHDLIEESDIRKGMASYSTDLLVELAREMEDVLPEYETLLWDFISSSRRISHEELIEVLNRAGVKQPEYERVLRRLLYYGFVGLMINEDEKYIYDFNYQIELVLANLRKLGANAVYCIHPAFRDSLRLAP